jgi:restriction system protein
MAYFFKTVLLTIWPFYALLILFALIKYALHLLEKHRLAASGINDIDRMGGETFEKYLEVLFEKLGYKVHRTRLVGDYGADLVIARDGVKTVVQAKRYESRAGVKAVQEAVAAKGYYDCDNSMVVTNSFYTNQAVELARRNRVELWNRNRLVKELLAAKSR